MRKLEKRESIIVGIMAIAILYGAFNLLFTMPQKKTSFPATAELSELQTIATAVTATVGKDILSVRDAYIIARAEMEWQQDPFMKWKDYQEMRHRAEAPKTGAEAPQMAFAYRGFMEFAGKRIAIINGVEYALGEALDRPGYILRFISPAKVIIEKTADRSRIEIPIQE